jgi:hypothetical protein
MFSMNVNVLPIPENSTIPTQIARTVAPQQPAAKSWMNPTNIVIDFFKYSPFLFAWGKNLFIQITINTYVTTYPWIDG